MINIGVDIGYGNTKVVFANGNGKMDGKIFKSVVGTYAQTDTNATGFSNDRTEVAVDGTKYLLGNSALVHSARLLNVRDKGWLTTPPYKALLKHALTVATHGKDVSGGAQIVTGLPVRYYHTDKEKIERVVAEVATSMGLNAEVKAIYQPMGTFFNLILDEQGMVFDRDTLHARLGILDIGFYTADLVTVNNREVVETLSMSCESGISTALDAIARDIEESEEYGCMRVNLHDLEAAIRSNCKIKVFGAPTDITPLVTRRMRELAAELQSKAQTVWHNGADLEMVLLTGGGAEMLAPYWNLYRHAKIVRSAPLANATGYCKYAQRSSGQS